MKSFLPLLLTAAVAGPAHAAEPVRVMSFNIRYGTAKDGEDHWEKRKEFLAETIAAYDPDLLGTQETLGFQRDYLAEKLKGYEPFSAGRDDGKEKGEMAALFFRKARFEKTAGGHFWLSPTPDTAGSKGWDAALHRIATWVKLKDLTAPDGKAVLFLNTHFDHMGKTARAESATLIRKRLAILGVGCRVIVTGDFNAGEGSGPYVSLFGKADDTPTPVVDSYRVAYPVREKTEGTFNGFKPAAIAGERIDWIGCSRDWEIQNAGIDRTLKNGRTPSDHWPVTAVLMAADTKPDESLAFPGAEGFGRHAKGGRGGDVYHVTNLNDAGPGSLRDGIATATGPRTIVFDVSGTIELKSKLVVDKSYLTIAGQTAPGDGICLKDQSFQIRKASHVIVRYLRVRLGDENKVKPAGFDAMTTDDVEHVMLDHLSVSWGIDGNHDLRRGGNVTVQWCIYAEALHDSLHEKGPHAMLASFRDLTAGVSIHHNLFASSRERHPTLGGSPRTKPDTVCDFRNNVVYNASGATNLGNCRINVVNNVYRPGPNTPAGNRPIATKAEVEGATKAFMAGNVFEGNDEFTRDNFKAVDFAKWSKGGYLAKTLEQVRAEVEFEVAGAKPETDDATTTFDRVLHKAGASLRRDAADARLVAGVKDRTHRMINSPKEVGNWPTLKPGLVPTDSDGDGMPDFWELVEGLNGKDPADRNAIRPGQKYTNLERYLNGLCR